MTSNDRVRLAEIVAALSLGVDLGFGQPMEHVLRQCLIALRLAERAGLDDRERATVYYTALLINVGCHTDAHEQARWFGDDLALKASKYEYGPHSVRGAAAALRMLGAGHPLVRRFRVGVEFAVSGYRDLARMIEHHAVMAGVLAEQLGLDDAVRDAVRAAYEQWDGKGWPGAMRGEAVPLAARLAQLAEFVEVAHRVSGVEGAAAIARQRSGGQFDPALADLVASEAATLLAGLDVVQTWDAVIDAEPTLAITLDSEQFDAALDAVANFVDLKSPYFLGHSTAVAALGGAAGADLGPDDVTALRRAAFVCGFGRLGVSNAIWDKPGPLGAGEWERVRLHPYLTERMVRQSAALSRPGAIAVQVRERLDGSGYPRGLSGNDLSRPARVLAAADMYQSLLEPRPHRPAQSAGDAAGVLRAEVRAGRLDGDAVGAVLRAAGHRVPRRTTAPDGLTAREVEVLRLAARGLTNKDIAATLVIAPKTVANHIEHIYAKIGVSSRALASMYALRHGLLADDQPVSRAPSRAPGRGASYVPRPRR